ncbi:MAG: hypothetical protein DWQ04_06360 [Chloroflexi bacterium]|nr:MAG: hypothetical protein DWQ04_06360 [Chloroflexota bacterium]
MTVTLNDICKLVGLQLGLRQVNGTDHILQNLGADSVDMVNIVATAEEKYQIEIDEAELTLLQTVSDLYQLIQRQIITNR